MGKNLKTPVSVRLSADELKILQQVADERFGGNKTKAVVEGLKRLTGKNGISRETLLAEIERRLK